MNPSPYKIIATKVLLEMEPNETKEISLSDISYASCRSYASQLKRMFGAIYQISKRDHSVFIHRLK